MASIGNILTTAKEKAEQVNKHTTITCPHCGKEFDDTTLKKIGRGSMKTLHVTGKIASGVSKVIPGGKVVRTVVNAVDNAIDTEELSKFTCPHCGKEIK